MEPTWAGHSQHTGSLWTGAEESTIHLRLVAFISWRKAVV